MAAAAAMTLASCSTNEVDPQNGGGEGKNARVGFSFVLPQGASAGLATRADDQIATGDEIKVNTVSVFVFDASGAPATIGHYTEFSGADVTTAFELGDATGGTANDNRLYTLKEESYIETVSGDAHIYVGLNLPASMRAHATATDEQGNPMSVFATEAAMLAAKANANGEVAGVAPAEGFAQSGDFTMFGRSNEAVVSLKEYVAGNAATVTEVPVTVERVVSKVVGTTQAADFDATKADGTTPALWDNGVQLNYEIKAYNVYNEASNSYLVYEEGKSDFGSIYDNLKSYFKNSNGGTIGTPIGGANEAITTYDITAPGNQTAVGTDPVLAAKPGFYIGENYSSYNSASNMSLNGNTTYAMVATQVTTNRTATWDEAAAGTNVNKVVWADAQTVAGNDLYIVKATELLTGKVSTFISTTLAEAEAISDGLAAMYTDTDGDGTIDYVDADAMNGTFDRGEETEAFIYSVSEVYTYLDSYVHFLVWLNRDGFNDYNIGRNQFVHVHVTGITGMDGNGNGTFPGYPGDPTDPEKPIDPEDKTNDNNPDPKDPGEEVEGGLAQMKVIITIKDWEYRQNGGQLSR